MIQTTNVAKTNNRLGIVKRDIAPSASKVFEDMLDFFCDVEPDLIPETEKERLITLLDDLDYLDRTQINESGADPEPIHANNWREINEGRLKAKHSNTPEKSAARKWYAQNKARVKTLALKLKISKGTQKKKQIMKKSDRTLTGRDKKQYNTDAHESTFKLGARAAVNRLFKNESYRVKQSFTVAGIDARLNETMEHVGKDTWILCKRSGRRFQIEIEDKKIMTCLKKGDLTAEDIINAI